MSDDEDGDLMIDGKLFTVRFEVDGKPVGFRTDFDLEHSEITPQIVADTVSDIVLNYLDRIDHGPSAWTK